jgi:hypothetical protein
MDKRLKIVLVVAVLGVLALAGGALAQGTPEVAWWVVAGGGGEASSGGGEVAVNYTVGQPIVGPAGDSPWLGAGYWYGAAGAYEIYLPLTLRDFG